MMKLRPYEDRAVDELLRRFKKCRRIVGVAPTGSGKTVIGSALIRRLKGKRVLWVAHRIELLRQAVEQLIAAGIPEKDVGILNSVKEHNRNARILVASPGMFGTRPVPKVDLLVIDEAHHVAAETYLSIVGRAPQALVLGLTATPRRLDGKPLGDVFESIFVMAEAIELIADGYIMESVVYGIPREKANALVQGLKPNGGDYSARKLDELMRKQPLMADIVREWFRLAKGLPTIVYACTIKHALEIRARFRKAGVTAEMLDWSTEARERKATLESLGRGEITVIVNVGILTEGIDCPPVKCIVLARPTMSLTLYRQMCGRGSRPSGARRPIVLDHSGNAWRHGLPEDLVEWSLNGKVLAGGDDPPVKLCGVCGVANSIAARKCKECGTEFPVTERELRERDAQLERIRLSEAARKQKEETLRRLATVKGLGEDWVQTSMREAS